jgi:hypothetical protein
MCIKVLHANIFAVAPVRQRKTHRRDPLDAKGTSCAVL